MYTNLEQYDALIQHIDMSIETYESMDKIFHSMSSSELSSVSHKYVKSIEEKLALNKEKADASVKINNINVALALYTECIDTYISMLENLPNLLNGKSPMKYALSRERYISNIYGIFYKMYLISQEYVSSYYDMRHEIKIRALDLDSFQLNNFYNVDYISRSSVSYIYSLHKLSYWDRRLLVSTVKQHIQNDSDKKVESNIYLNYLSRVGFANKWSGNLQVDITNPRYKYYEGDIELYIDIIILKAQLTSFTNLNLAIEHYSLIENTCKELLNKDNIDYFLKLKSNLAIEFHSRVEDIYKEVLSSDQCKLELQASLAIASFGKARAYELLDASNLYNYQMAVDSYSKSLSALNDVSNSMSNIDDYSYSNELIQFSAKVHDSRAMLYNKLDQFHLAKIDYEKVAQLHYSTCHSKMIRIEDQVDWFLQGILFINDTNNGFHDSRTFDLLSIEQPLRIFNYTIFEGENIILRLFQLKFDLTILNSDDVTIKNDLILLANIMHALGNAFVLNAIQNNSVEQPCFSSSSSIYEGDPEISDHLLSAVGEIESAFEFVKILDRYESHRSNLEIAVKLHTQAISIMTQHGYSYTPIWDYDLNISSQLLEYKDNQSQMFDIPF